MEHPMSTALGPSLADFGDMLTVEEAGRILRIGRSAAYNAARSGELPTVRIGRSVRVSKHALAAMLGLNGETPRTSLPSARKTTSGAADAGHVIPAA
jgi:excisionase family DNA binding protein